MDVSTLHTKRSIRKAAYAMTPRPRPALSIGLAAVGSILLVGTLGAQAKITPHQCPPCASLVNAFVRVDASPFGTWVMGTTGGDPASPADDNKKLIYGFQPGGTSHPASSYATVRLTGPRGSRDILPAASDTIAQRTYSETIDTVWAFTDLYAVRVTETLQVLANPFSGAPDAVTLGFHATNLDTVTVNVGVRALLDVMIGDNTDGAPFQVPGVGNVTTEREFLGDDVPPYWLAFESQTLDPRGLRSVGILDGPGITRPDRFVLASWPDIMKELWSYAITPSKVITTDSSVALYWDPEPLAPGASMRWTTGYGLAGQGGGDAFLTAQNARPGDTVPVSLFVRNLAPDPLTGGQATLLLPAGLAVAPGEVATRPMPTIAPRDTGSLVWQVTVGPAACGDVTLSADATFDGGKRFQPQHVMRVTCDTPTATTVPPTETATSPPTPTATATAIPPTATPSPTPPPSPTTAPSATPNNGAAVCAFIRDRVPVQVINAALANPSAILGWDTLANPNLAPGPYNPRCRYLSLLNIARAYHVTWNPVVYKAGCP